jgi:tripartite-type tricarboxylate transporter receptor subunit TctC
MLLTLAAAGSLAGGDARAEETWPTRPLRMIIPFPPGGPSDGVGRLIAEALMPRLGQPIVADNRPGAGSVIGTATAAQSADGHTLLLASNSFTVNTSLQPRLPYDPVADFEPIGLISNTPLVVAVPADSLIRNVAGLIVTARARPGELTYASAGNGTVNHLAAELFKDRVGVEITNITYRGDAALLPDLLNGTVSMSFINLPTALPFARQGQLRVLAVMATERLAALLNVPTLAAAGVDGVEVGGMQALLAARHPGGGPAQARTRAGRGAGRSVHADASHLPWRIAGERRTGASAAVPGQPDRALEGSGAEPRHPRRVGAGNENHAAQRYWQWSAFTAFSARNQPGSTIPAASAMRSDGPTPKVAAA